VDNGVALLLAPPGGGFAPAARLAGHTDWVRSLAFRRGAGARCGPRTPLAPAPGAPVPAQPQETGGFEQQVQFRSLLAVCWLLDMACHGMSLRLPGHTGQQLA